MDCKNLKGCPFFNHKMPIESGLGLMYKKKYCLGDPGTCARYRVSTVLGKEYVPANLYPNMNEKADEILKQNQKGA